MKIKFAYILAISICFISSSYAVEKWHFEKTYETERLTEVPFYLFATADLNHNRKSEIIVADFGRHGNHDRESIYWVPSDKPSDRPDDYMLAVLEWHDNKLDIKFKKAWTDSEMHDLWYRFEIEQLLVLKVNGRITVEAEPAYFGIEWENNQYVFREQREKPRLIGSWIYPWQTPGCHTEFGGHKWPIECLYGIRDFFGDGTLRIFSFSQEKEHGEQIFKIRRNEPGFPVEWEYKTGSKEVFYSKGSDRFRAFGRKGNNIKSGFLLSYLRDDSIYILRPADKKRDSKYEIVKIGKWPLSIKNYDLPDFYIAKTRSRDIEEYFGYRFIRAYDGNNRPIISSLELKSDMSGFIQRDIQFPTHKKNLGVGYFDVKDIDGDGIDEIILVEQNGKREYFEPDEVFFYSDVKDYIKILKWTGKKYEVMWESPPYDKRGTKVLIDDVKGTGKKQLVILTREGTVQIWERK